MNTFLYILIDDNIFIKDVPDIILYFSLYFVISYKLYFHISESSIAIIYFLCFCDNLNDSYCIISIYIKKYFQTNYYLHLYCLIICQIYSTTLTLIFSLFCLMLQTISFRKCHVKIITYQHILNIIYCKFYYELKITTFYESNIIHIFLPTLHYFQNIKVNSVYYFFKIYTKNTNSFNLLFGCNVGRQ